MEYTKYREWKRRMQARQNCIYNTKSRIYIQFNGKDSSDDKSVKIGYPSHRKPGWRQALQSQKVQNLSRYVLYAKTFLFCNYTTPEVTLGEACRASCSFPIAYEHYHMQINGKDHKFWDGGMCENPKIPEGGFTVLATFKKEKENLKSRYVNAWKFPEECADFVIKPEVHLGTFGTPQDIAEASQLGYVEAKKQMKQLLYLLR